MNAESVQNYEKTAQAILEAPWCLDGAAAYLLDWLKRNQAGEVGEPPRLLFVVEGREFLPEAMADPLVTRKDFAPRTAVPIVPGKGKKQAPGKRPQEAPELAGMSRRARARLAAEVPEGVLPAAEVESKQPAATPRERLHGKQPVAQGAPEAVEAEGETERKRTQEHVVRWGLSRLTPKLQDGVTRAWQITCPGHAKCNRARNVGACSSEAECLRMLKQ